MENINILGIIVTKGGVIGPAENLCSAKSGHQKCLSKSEVISIRSSLSGRQSGRWDRRINREGQKNHWKTWQMTFYSIDLSSLNSLFSIKFSKMRAAVEWKIDMKEGCWKRKKNPEPETVEKLNERTRKAVGVCACCECSSTDQGYHRIVTYNKGKTGWLGPPTL